MITTESLTWGGTESLIRAQLQLDDDNAMDSAASHHALGISPFADSDDSSSPSPVSTDHVPIDVLVEPTPRGIPAFFLDSDEDEQIDDEIVDPRDQLTTSSVLLSESDDDLRIILPYSV
ncbi:hypothetical protein Tco_0023275, partial [Tanacetum coccineum]